MVTQRLIAALVLTAGLVGCSGITQLDFTTLGRGSWQRPEDVVRALEIEAGAQVADLGAGEGYFLPFLRDAVGAEGTVYAVELDPEKLNLLRERFPAQDNVAVVAGDSDDPQLPDGAIDLVLLVNTYHHIEDRKAYFNRLRRDLSPGAKVAIIDPDADLRGLLSLFLEEGHTSHAAEVRREMVAAGYRNSESFDLLPVQLFEVFVPDPPAATAPANPSAVGTLESRGRSG